MKLSGGLPHSEIHGSKLILSSPWLIAEYHVFHRLLLPRHSPNALLALDLIQKEKDTRYLCYRLFGYLSTSMSIATAQLVTKGDLSSEPKAYFPAFHPGTRAADVGRPHAEDRRQCITVKLCGLVYLTWTTLFVSAGIFKEGRGNIPNQTSSEEDQLRSTPHSARSNSVD